MTKEQIGTVIDLIRKNDNLEIKRDIFASFTEHANDIPLDWIRDILVSNEVSVRRVAISMIIVDSNRSDIPLEWIDLARRDRDWYIRYQIYHIFSKREDIPVEWMIDALSDPEPLDFLRLVLVFDDVDDIPIEISKMALNPNEHNTVREAACTVLLNKYFNTETEEGKTENESI